MVGAAVDKHALDILDGVECAAVVGAAVVGVAEVAAVVGAAVVGAVVVSNSMLMWR